MACSSSSASSSSEELGGGLGALRLAFFVALDAGASAEAAEAGWVLGGAAAAPAGAGGACEGELAWSGSGSGLDSAGCSSGPAPYIFGCHVKIFKTAARKLRAYGAMGLVACCRDVCL